MRCIAYCTASSYDIQGLQESLKDRYATNRFREVLHVEVPHGEGMGDVFFFPYGALTFWDLSKEKEKELLEEIQDFESKPVDEIESETFTVFMGETPSIHKEEIFLPDRDALTLLAVSHAFAQSVKLGEFERTIQESYDKTKQIPEDLAHDGKISLSRREIRKKMGALLCSRNSINLHMEVLDTPEFFWDHPNLDHLYTLTANYLDIETRVEVLNQRLDVVHELFEMLGSELNHQHSSRLEWTIICLIVIEVLVSLYQML